MYSSIADADTYFDETDLSGTWATYTDDEKTKSMNLASRQIDRLAFQGQKYEFEQLQEFPRLLRVDSGWIYWDQHPSTGEIQVPELINEAVYLQAKFLLDNRDSDTITNQRLGITSESVGSTSQSYDFSNLSFDRETELNLQSKTLVQQYLLVSV